MRKLLLSLTLLLIALLSPPSSRAQFVVTGQACGASGLNAIANDGTPVVCRGNPLVWTAVGGGGGSPVVSLPGPVFNVKDPKYGAKGDAQRIADGVTGGGTKTLTSATAAFCNGGSVPCTAGRSSDVGKKIVCGGAAFSTIATILSVTATVATTDTTDGGGAAGLKCTWYTQDDTAAMQAAVTAASPSTSINDPNHGKVLQPFPGTVYCPNGGYAVSSRFFNFAGSAGNNIGPNFIGEGRDKCMIYVLPTIVDPNDGLPVVMSTDLTVGTKFADFTIDGLGFGVNSSHALIGMLNSVQFKFENVDITNISTNNNSHGTIDFAGSSNGVVDNVFLQGGGSTSDFACVFNGASGIIVRNLTCSNHNQNLLVANTGVRGVAGDNGITFIGGIMDECGSTTAPCSVISNSGLANFNETTFMGSSAPPNYALSVDGTSRAYLSQVSCGVFGSTTAVTSCLNILSGGFVTAQNSDLRGNDSNSTTGAAVAGPAGATFVDVGGNKILHSVSGVISTVTPAQYTTLAFTGGIVPKSTQTHTPNTCYAVTGNLLATVQNLCIVLLDQNYQLLTLSAQSGGTTPANSSCATPPVITLSDGTRSATMTMTSGKTQWFSNVDAVTSINQIFASGSTLTVSIGANTCATPPSNVSVNFDIQSVINP